MSRGLGVQQKRILEILSFGYPEYMSRNRLVFILGAVRYPNLSIKPLIKIKCKLKQTKKEKDLIKQGMIVKERISKSIDRDIQSLKKRKLILIKEKNKHKYIKINKKGLKTYNNFNKENWKTEKDLIEHQKRIIELMNILGSIIHKSKNFKRSNLNCKKHIKTKREFKLSDYVKKLKSE